jgi:hypothetical protein
MPDGPLAYPRAAVRTGCGLRSVVELQFILASLEILFWAGFPGLTYQM